MRGLPPACTDTGHRRHGRAHRHADACRRRRTACSSSSSSTTRSTARCATAAASARCRTRRSAFGPGESRFVEEKRHFAKPIPICELVLLDRERCILCARCTRFADEIAGDPLIDFGERGGEIAGHHLPRRAVHLLLLGEHRADLPGRRAAPPRRTGSGPGRGTSTSVETSCHDVLGAAAAARCSRRRTGSSACSASTPSRSTTAGCATRAASATSACTAADRIERAAWSATRRRARRRRRGPRRSTPPPTGCAGVRRPARRRTSVAVIGGARGTNEDAYAWARFAKGVLGTDNVDAQLGDGLPAEVVLGLPRATIADLRPRRRRSCCSAPTSRKSCRSSTCGCGGPPSSSGSR